MTPVKKIESVLVIVLGLIFLSIVFENSYILYSALVIGVISLISKSVLNLLTNVWFGLAKLLGKVINPIVLSVFFFLFLTPIALLYRIVGKKRRSEKYVENSSSVYVERQYVYSSKDLENTW